MKRWIALLPAAVVLSGCMSMGEPRPVVSSQPPEVVEAVEVPPTVTRIITVPMPKAPLPAPLLQLVAGNEASSRMAAYQLLDASDTEIESRVASRLSLAYWSLTSSDPNGATTAVELLAQAQQEMATDISLRDAYQPFFMALQQLLKSVQQRELLQGQVESLKGDLQRRDEAIKRLRELSLGS